jgi:mannosyl-oligosaccharide glucosidase
MAVTAFIDRFKAANGHNADGPSDADLGMDNMGGAAQVPLGVPQTADSHISNRHVQDRDLAFSYLESIYEPLKRHYQWFRRTQRGQIKQYARQARSRTEGYRWRGRSEQHVLTSGMDDYPRGPPHAGELHLDLISWMAFFSRTMKDISGFIGEKDDEANFAKIEKAILDNIEGALLPILVVRYNSDHRPPDLHWKEEEQMYCDVGVNDDGTALFASVARCDTEQDLFTRRVSPHLP